MGKAKTKRGLLDVILTEINPDEWQWTYTAGGFTFCWRWRNLPGMNTLFRTGEGPWQQAAFFARNDLAVAFSIGWTEGMAEHARLTRAALQAVRDAAAAAKEKPQ